VPQTEWTGAYVVRAAMACILTFSSRCYKLKVSVQ
jgi:hypothetical protein